MDVIKMAGELLKSKVKGRKWVDAAMPTVMGVVKEVKKVEEMKQEETKPLRELIGDIGKKYEGALMVLDKINEELRERIMKEYEETTTIKQDGVGELVFVQLWSFEVVDVRKVESEFLTVNSSLVNNEIKKGIRNIKGLNIIKKRILQVRPFNVT